MSFLQHLSAGGWRPDRAKSLVEVLLILALATQAARLVWTVGAPAPPPAPTLSSRATADLTILTRFNPFLGIDAPAGGSGEGLKLYGVRASGDGRGSAIIGAADGRQASYLVGETIAPGVVLQAVEADHVVISRGGAPGKLTFPDAP